MEKETFSHFLSRNWWLLLISFVHIVRGSEDFSSGERIIVSLATSGVIFFLMFLYWNFKNKK